MTISVTTMSLDFDASSGPNNLLFEQNEVTIGRLPGNDIVLNHAHVSGHHAKLIVGTDDKGNQVLKLVDLGSKNGTFIGQVRLIPGAEVALKNHDRVRVANFLMRPVFTPSDIPEPVEQIEQTEQIEQMGQMAAGGGGVVAHSGRIITDSGKRGSVSEFCRSTQLVTADLLEAVKMDFAKPSPDTAAYPFIPQFVPASVEGQQEQVIDIPVATAAEIPSFDDGDDEEAIRTIDFVATKLCSLSVSIVHNGQPLAGVAIDARGMGSAFTDGAGIARFADIREGTSYAVTASRSGYLFRDGEMNGVLDSDDTLVLSATKLFAVKGKVMHRGAPLAGAKVDAGVVGSTVTAADGTYCFRDVPEDVSINIAVSKDGFVIEPSK